VDWQGGVPLEHSFAGSVPAANGVQVPTFPAWLHDTHAPVQAELQHTPSVQKPLAHSAALVHVLPFDVLQAPVASQA
jgi:hypothetical protein